MRRYPYSTLAASLFVLATSCWFLDTHRDVRVSVPLASLQSSLDSRIPLSGHAGPSRWKVEHAALSLPGGGDVGLDASGTAGVMRWDATFHLAGRARLSYSDGEFWLADARVERLEVKRSDDRPIDGLEAVASRMVSKAILRHPDGALDFVLSRFPVYRLPQTLRGSAERAILTSVTATNGAIVVVLDPLGGLAWAAAAMVAVAASLLLGFILLAPLFLASGPESVILAVFLALP